MGSERLTKTVECLLAEEFGGFDSLGAYSSYLLDEEAKLILMNCEEQVMASFADIYGVDQTSAWLRGE